MHSPTNRTKKHLAAVCIAACSAISLSLGSHGHAALIYPATPAGGREAAYKMLPIFEHGPKAFPDAPPLKELTIARPYQTYSVRFSDVLAGRLLSVATPWNWRYPVRHGSKVVAEVEVVARGKFAKAPQAVSVGAVNQETSRILREANDFSTAEKRDYEVRFLNVAPLNFAAVWLHGKTADLLIPLGGYYGKFKPFHRYTESQVIKVLLPEAIHRKNSPGRFGSTSRATNSAS